MWSRNEAERSLSHMYIYIYINIIIIWHVFFNVIIHHEILWNYVNKRQHGYYLWYVVWIQLARTHTHQNSLVLDVLTSACFVTTRSISQKHTKTKQQNFDPLLLLPKHNPFYLFFLKPSNGSLSCISFARYTVVFLMTRHLTTDLMSSPAAACCSAWPNGFKSESHYTSRDPK